MIEIYTDGSYSSSRDQGGWAFVATKEGEKIHSDFDGVMETTNNRMEIQGTLEAMKWLIKNDIEEAIIFTDSMYVIGTMTKNWKRKKNTDLWPLMDEASSKVNIEWKHVKGHSGDKFNEMCDVLAVHGSQLILK